ncbi:hypothetical protein CEXT_707491 [Caerostris extrusa]|uniref:Uncharacterized protein n=1 Tax=Caerostris extrusa TaxID=172846 RepID=A0AAV4Y9W8_CAEEX|nr:hypothetical protein CEXT_707491 [Caerostris extrusa]
MVNGQFPSVANFASSSFLPVVICHKRSGCKWRSNNRAHQPPCSRLHWQPATHSSGETSEKRAVPFRISECSPLFTQGNEEKEREERYQASKGTKRQKTRTLSLHCRSSQWRLSFAEFLPLSHRNGKNCTQLPRTVVNAFVSGDTDLLCVHSQSFEVQIVLKENVGAKSCVCLIR